MSTDPTDRSQLLRNITGVDDDPLRPRWMSIRLLLMTLSAVCLLIGVAAQKHALAATIFSSSAAASILLASCWDLVFLRRRWHRVQRGLERINYIDPMDSWVNVAGFGFLSSLAAIWNHHLSSSVRALIGTCATACVVISYGGYRYYRTWKGPGWKERRRMDAALDAEIESRKHR